MKFFSKSLLIIAMAMLLAAPKSLTAAAEGSAGLLLLPPRIEIGERERNVELTIKNNGTARGLYRIEVIDMEMPETGPIKEIEEGKPAPYSAKDFVRISPRRVVLDQDEAQSIRIIVRRPAELEDGEYRSHIKVTLVEKNVDPQGNPIDTKAENKNVRVEIKARFAMAIPFIVREGNPTVSMKLTDANLRTEEGVHYLDATLEREGDRSAYGDLTVTYIAKDGKKTVVKHQPGLAVYRPTAKRKVSLQLELPDGLKIDGGKMHIQYVEQEKDGGDLLVEKEIKV